MIKRLTTLLALAAALASLVSVSPKSAMAQAQPRRIMLEEFTGAWCGWCVRGALAIKQLDDAYPGQVVPVAIHGPMNYQEPMATLQGDSLINKLGGGPGDPNGYPDGWTARTNVGSSWNVDPGSWIDTVTGQGIAEQMLGQKPDAAVSVDNISYNEATQMCTARVNVKFNTAQSGDLRFNLYVVEDSIVGQTGANKALWDQHNYYFQNPGYPGSPYYNLGTLFLYNGQPDGSIISSYVFNHVFRQAVSGVWGVKGVIPASAAAGSSYSQTFSFPLPDNVGDYHHVKLVGFVHQYNVSNMASNQILDADQQPLVGVAPKYLFTDITITSTPYTSAKSGGDTPQTISFSNNGTDPVTLNLSVGGAALPTGWSAKLDPAQVVVPPGNVRTSTLTVTAPTQSAYVTMSVIAQPFKQDYLSTQYHSGVSYLSDNTLYGMYETPGFSPSAAITSSIPASLQSNLAMIPLSTDVITAFPIENMKIAIFDNDPVLGGNFLTPPNSVAAIESILDAGGKVLFTSDLAMALQYYTSDARNATAATDDALSFFEDTLGISYRTTELRYNTSTGAYQNFTYKGVSGDPIGNGLSLSAIGSEYSAPFDINPGSNSVPCFYFDNKPAYNAGVRYTNPQTGGKMVYLGFNLNAISTQKNADTIAARSIAWLLAAPTGGVEDNHATTSGISASLNPFHGTTEINFVAGAGEGNVSFGVYDVLGRQVAKLAPRVTGENSYSATFDGSSLAEGAYTVIAQTSKGTKEIKVVNQK